MILVNHLLKQQGYSVTRYNRHIFQTLLKKLNFHQELLVLLWKCCKYNQKVLFYVSKTSVVLEILVPILYHITESRNDPTRVGLIHMGVFLVLLLSGERNFGVRLNKPCIAKAAIDIQSFTVSPYLKSLSMVAANKLLHLVEAFSTPWFLFSTPTHHLVFFLLVVFNNIVQYQFSGISNLIYTIIRKRQVFYQLANLQTDSASISKTLSGRKGKAREDMVDQLKSPTAPITPEIPTGRLELFLNQATSTPSSSDATDEKPASGEVRAPTAE